MQKVNATPDYMSTLRNLAQDHMKIMRQFEAIPQSHPAIYGIQIISGVAAAVFSLKFYHKYPHQAAILFSLSSIFVLFTIRRIYSIVTSISTQTQSIHALFTPCEEGLKNQRTKKIQYLIDKINGQHKESLRAVKESVDHEETTYDKSIEELIQLAHTIKDLNSLLPDGIAELAKDKLRTVIALSHRFIVGDKLDDNPGDDAYVKYRLSPSGEAVLEERFRMGRNR